MSELLTPDEIGRMRQELTENPPFVAPPPDRPWWDVKRILCTLEYLTKQNAHLIEYGQTAHEAIKGITDPHLMKETELKSCPQCERLNNVNNHFCAWCGVQLRMTCALCGKSLGMMKP